MKAVKLKLPEIAKFSISDDIIHSDTLFSAIVNCYVMLFGDEEENLKKFIEQIKISSIFLGLDIKGNNSNKTIYFLPKPILNYEIISEKEKRKLTKKWKKVKYISLKLLEKMEDKVNLDSILVNGNFAILKEEDNSFNFEDLKFIKRSSEPKNKINRFNNKSEAIFFKDITEYLCVNENSFEIKPFMYFYVENEISKELKATIKLMCEEGIGADRTTGKGIFIELEKIDKIDIGNIKNRINLSLIYPKIEDVEGIGTYKLLKRGGFIYKNGGTGTRKDVIRMFEEGSVWNRKVEGCNKETIFNENTIYHYGKAFLIGGDNQ
jgi:CRISPR-associated protein Csm4